MYRGKYVSKHGAKHEPRSRRSRVTALALSAVLLVALAIGGTLAWLTARSENVTNSFTVGHVSCQVTETFKDNVKSNVNVKNTGDVPAYIRVKLVTYRTNADGQHIGGTATLPSFTLGTGWVLHDGYYYYTLPVAAGGTPATNLTDSMTLTNSYDDADGGKQAIDVMAEAIQSVPAQAVGEAWGVSISEGGVTPYGQ